MKHIKFREWDGERMVPFSEIIDLPLSRFNPETLMQFTGLADKNGRDVYEGDVVRDIAGDPGVVKFGHYSAGGLDYYASCAYGFYVQRRSGSQETEDNTETLGAFGDIEVLGNIYEHPHLLEATEATQVKPE